MKTLSVRIKLNNPIMEIRLTSEQYKDFKKLSREKQEDLIMSKGTIRYSSLEVNKRSSIKIEHYD